VFPAITLTIQSCTLPERVTPKIFDIRLRSKQVLPTSSRLEGASPSETQSNEA
jgi:hypothetical protein